MAVGPGKYDELCTEARTKAKAAGAILLIFEGDKGFGFSVQLPVDKLTSVAKVLRTVADTIERDAPKDIQKIVESN